MKTKNRFLALFALSVACFAFLIACDNIIGLGARVNTEVPAITTPPGDGLLQNPPGSFLRGTAARVEVVVEQEFGIDHVFMSIWYTPLGGNAESLEPRIVPGVRGEDNVWGFVFDTTGMEDGEFRAQVTAVDVDGNFSTTPNILYRVLNTPPVLTLSVPALEEYVNERSRGLTSTVSFMGTVSLNVTRIYYALGVTEIANAYINEGTPPTETGWTDTLLHTSSPLAGHQRPGLNFYDIIPSRLTWSGSIDTGFVWRFLNIADIVDPAYYVEPAPYPFDDPESNLWVLPITFKLVDVAGNVGLTTVRALIDPDADLPVTTITSHADRQVVGGPIRVSGTSQDNEVIHTVYMRIFTQTAAQAGTDAMPTELVHDWIDIASGFGSAFVSWAVAINQSGELDPPPGIDRRLALLEFRSSDAFIFSPNEFKSFGNIEAVLLEFDNSVPIIGTPVILSGSPSEIGTAAIGTAPGEYFDFAEGSTVAGFVTMRIVLETPSSGLQHVRLRGEGVDIDLREAVNNPGHNDSDPWLTESGPRPSGAEGVAYTLFIPLNTTGPLSSSLLGSGFANDTAPFPLQIQLADYTTPAPFIAQGSFTLRIDNRPPLGRYTGDLIAINPAFTIAGQAWDHGPGVRVHGIERVVVYFSRAGIPLTLAGNPGGSWVNTQQAMTGRTPDAGIGIATEGTLATLPFFPSNFTASGTGIQIDRSGVLGASAGTLGSAPMHNWNASFNFAGFDDGPLTVHYVIFDRAGNATHFSQDITLVINRPVIRTVHLGTDIRPAPNPGPGPVFTPRAVLHEPVNAYFRARNNNFSFRLDVSNPAGVPFAESLHFDVAHVTLQSPTAIPAALMMEGGVYRIATRGTATGPNAVNWVSYGVLVDLTTLVGGVLIDPVGITFVATRNGTPANNGTVYRYVVPALGNRRVEGTWTSGPETNAVSPSTLTFGLGSFGPIGSTAQIPESQKTLSSDGFNFDLHNDRYFLVRVRSTPTPGTDIWNAVLVRADIHNEDTMAPVIRLAHFGQRAVGSTGVVPVAIPNFANRSIVDLAADGSEYDMNIVMTPGNQRRGYVQYHWHSASPVADISGRVIFRGMAADNNRIATITATIGGTVSGGTPPVGGISSGTSVTGGTTYPVAHWDTDGLMSTGGGIAAMREPTSTAIWGFDASHQSNTLAYSHVLNWEFAWDSARLADTVIGAVAANDVPITFTVTDLGGNSFSQTIRVNVVPYITELVTPLSAAFPANPSAFNRSALGWYPVRENDQVTIRGFNLGGNVSLNGTALTTVGALTTSEVQVNIGTIATSGRLVVTVNGIQSLNHRNDNDAHYNREPNNLNNNILSDARYMYVWQTGFLLNSPVIDTPIMRMRPNSYWALTYGVFGNAPVGHGAPTVTALRVLRSRGSGAPAGAITDVMAQAGVPGTGVNRYTHLGMAMDESNNWYVGASNIASMAGNLQNFALYARVPTSDLNPNYALSVNHGTFSRNLIRLGPGPAPFGTGAGDPNRIRTPSLFAQNTNSGATGNNANATRVLVGYFDSLGNDNAVIFHYGLVGNAGSASAGFGGNLSNTGGPAPTGYDPVTHLFMPVVSAPGAPGMPQVIANNSTTHRGSQHVAVGALQNGLPVVAWFDRVNQTLVLSHGNTAPTTTDVTLPTSISNTSTAVWQSNARVIHQGAGTHVSMAIDANNVIHLAYHDVLTRGLFYARIYPTGTGSSMVPNMNNIHVARVDTFLAPGTRVSINVRSELIGGNAVNVPYISYFHTSFAQTRNSIRVAWLVRNQPAPGPFNQLSIRHGTYGSGLSLGGGIHSAPGSAASAERPADSFTGHWEVMTVPANHVPVANEFVSIGVPSSGNFRAPTSSGGANSPLNSGWAADRSLRYSVLVGYMTSQYYEGAVLKHDIWQ